MWQTLHTVLPPLWSPQTAPQPAVKQHEKVSVARLRRRRLAQRVTAVAGADGAEQEGARAQPGRSPLPYLRAHRLASSFASPLSYEAALASRALRWLLVSSTASRLARLHKTSTRDPVFSEKRFMQAVRLPRRQRSASKCRLRL